MTEEITRKRTVTLPGPKGDEGIAGLPGRIRLLIGEGSVSAFASKCGLLESSIRQYLKGSEPSAGKLVAIATAMGVNFEWLLIGLGPMRSDDARDSNHDGILKFMESDRALLEKCFWYVEEILQRAGKQDSPADFRARLAIEMFEKEKAEVAGVNLRETKKTALDISAEVAPRRGEH